MAIVRIARISFAERPTGNHDGEGMEIDIDEGLRSSDERTRAAAVRAICPCHGSFDELRKHEDELRRIVREEPSDRVRGEARHVLRDAFVVNHNDERRQARDDRAVAREAERERRRALADERARRRARPRRRPTR